MGLVLLPPLELNREVEKEEREGIVEIDEDDEDRDA